MKIKRMLKYASVALVLGMVFLAGGNCFAEELNDKEQVLLNTKGEVSTEVTGEEKESVIKTADSILLFLNVKNNGSEEKVYLVDGSNSLNKTEEYYKVLYNGDSYVSFTKDGDLIESGTFFYSLPKADSTLRTRALGDDESSIGMTQNILEKKGYVLKEKKNYYNNNVFYRFEKVIDGVLTNKYDSYTVIYNPERNNIVSFTKVSDPVSYEKPQISGEQAMESANKYLREKYKDQDFNAASTKLDVLKQDENSSPIVVYAVSVDNGNQVMVDTRDGNVITENFTKGYFKGKAVGYSGFPHVNESIRLANNGMSRLGYSMLSSTVTSGDITNPIKNAITTDGFRALYTDVHGSSSSLSTDTDRLTASTLSSSYPKMQLRFVFLDACSTGASTTWANTFKISSSWGAFVGWSGNVYESDAYDFAKVFWSEADGRKPILKAVQNAESRVSTNVDPVFIGNNTFYGTAN